MMQAKGAGAMSKCVFLDRDGTIIEDPGYLHDVRDVKLLPGAALAIKSLREEGYKIVVVTNQSGIARGIITEENLDAIHAEICRLLAEDGAHVDAIYYCPFHPDGTVEKYAKESDLRKPQPGMLLRAAEEHDIDLTQSWMVGDAARDVEAGQRAGCKTIRLRTHTMHATGDTSEDAQADYTLRNIGAASRLILRQPPADAQGEHEHHPTPGARNSEAQAPDTANETRSEILRYVRQLARADAENQFNFMKVLGSLAQAIAILALVGAIATAMGLSMANRILTAQLAEAQIWALVALTFQVMALTFFTVARR